MNRKNIKAGMWFSAVIANTFCIGRIQQENGHWYLCQNELAGLDCSDKFGFTHTWGIGRQYIDPFSKSTMIEHNVYYFNIYKEKPTKVVKPKFKVITNNSMADEYDSVAYKGVGLIVGCSFFPAKELMAFKRAIPKLQKRIKKFTGVAKGTYETHVLKTNTENSRYVQIYLNKMDYDGRFELRLSLVNKIIDYVTTK